LSKCNCKPTYQGECLACDGNEDCWQCEDGFVEVDQSLYEVDKNTERQFIVVHQEEFTRR
jgi:hypothetical protein